MTTQGDEDRKTKTRICIFAFILGICTLIDHLFWVIYKSVSAWWTYSNLEQVILGRAYEEIVADIRYAKLLLVAFHAQGWTGQIVHGWRFWIYVAFNKTMRDGFAKAIGKLHRKVTIGDS